MYPSNMYMYNSLFLSGKEWMLNFAMIMPTIACSNYKHLKPTLHILYAVKNIGINNLIHELIIYPELPKTITKVSCLLRHKKWYTNTHSPHKLYLLVLYFNAAHSIWLVWIEVLDSSPQGADCWSWFCGSTSMTFTEVPPPTTSPRDTQLSTEPVELLPPPLTCSIPPPLPTVPFSFSSLVVAVNSLPCDRVHGGQWWPSGISAGLKATLAPSRRLSRPLSIVKSTTKVRHLPGQIHCTSEGSRSAVFF